MSLTCLLSQTLLNHQVDPRRTAETETNICSTLQCLFPMLWIWSSKAGKEGEMAREQRTLVLEDPNASFGPRSNRTMVTLRKLTLGPEQEVGAMRAMFSMMCNVCYVFDVFDVDYGCYVCHRILQMTRTAAAAARENEWMWRMVVERGVRFSFFAIASKGCLIAQLVESFYVLKNNPIYCLLIDSKPCRPIRGTTFYLAPRQVCKLIHSTNYYNPIDLYWLLILLNS